MCLSDTAEYWQDIKSRTIKHVFTHAKGINCGHYQLSTSNSLDEIDCYACKKLIANDSPLQLRLEKDNQRDIVRRNAQRKKKKGFKLDSIIKFGKFKGHNKSIQSLIDTEKSYWNWLQDKILLHPEVDNYLSNLK